MTEIENLFIACVSISTSTTKNTSRTVKGLASVLKPWFRRGTKNKARGVLVIAIQGVFGCC